MYVCVFERECVCVCVFERGGRDEIERSILCLNKARSVKLPSERHTHTNQQLSILSLSLNIYTNLLLNFEKKLERQGESFSKIDDMFFFVSRSKLKFYKTYLSSSLSLLSSLRSSLLPTSPIHDLSYIKKKSSCCTLCMYVWKIYYSIQFEIFLGFAFPVVVFVEWYTVLLDVCGLFLSLHIHASVACVSSSS